jgi:hypothetical protein
MKRSVRRRVLTMLATTLLIILALEVPALAAPPTNDAITSATGLGTPPKNFVIDTQEATASSSDGGCVFGRSVWFKTHPGTTRTVRLSTLGSDYDTVLAVFRGPRTDRTRIACVNDSFDINPSEARQVRFVAGKTYWVAVSACCSRTAHGGQLVLNTFLPTPAGVETTIESVESGAISGRLLIHGTAQCTTPSELELDVSASQRVGGGTNVASGEGFGDVICGADESPWTAKVDSQTGWAFQPTGKTSVTVDSFVYDGFDFTEGEPLSGNFDVTDDPIGFTR